MKLSQFSTAESADLLCTISPLLDEIVQDERIMEEIGKPIERKERTNIGLLMEASKRVCAVLPVLLKDHRAALFGILAAVNRCEVEEIEKQPIGATVKMVKELVLDKEFRDFFSMSASVELE